MLDIFKKNPEEEQKASEQEQVKSIDEQKAAQERDAEETILSMLQRLSEEEHLLTTEKSQLADMEEKLRVKIIDEIETKKRKIEDLKTEIPELKQKCENLAKALDIPVYK